MQAIKSYKTWKNVFPKPHVSNLVQKRKDAFQNILKQFDQKWHFNEFQWGNILCTVG